MIPAIWRSNAGADTGARFDHTLFREDFHSFSNYSPANFEFRTKHRLIGELFACFPVTTHYSVANFFNYLAMNPTARVSPTNCFVHANISFLTR